MAFYQIFISFSDSKNRCLWKISTVFDKIQISNNFSEAKAQMKALNVFTIFNF